MQQNDVRKAPRPNRPVFRLAVFGATMAAVFAAAAPAGADMPHVRDSVPLPVDFAPEGVSVGSGSTFYVGSLTSGDIFRGDLRTGKGRVFIHGRPGQNEAVGLKADPEHHLLFVAGGTNGSASVYDTRTGATVATYQFGPTDGSALVNDVVITRGGAYFTSSFAPVLYEIPIGSHGNLGRGRTITLSGPAATTVSQQINLNGIAAPADGSALIVNNTALGALFKIDPVTGKSAALNVPGGLPKGNTDGLLLTGKSLWTVENFSNSIARVTLNSDLSSGKITASATSPLFRVPTTVAKYGDRLVAVNARYDLGIPPPGGPGAPPGTDYNVVTVRMPPR